VRVRAEGCSRDSWKSAVASIMETTRELQMSPRLLTKALQSSFSTNRCLQCSVVGTTGCWIFDAVLPPAGPSPNSTPRWSLHADPPRLLAKALQLSVINLTMLAKYLSGHW